MYATKRSVRILSELWKIAGKNISSDSIRAKKNIQKKENGLDCTASDNESSLVMHCKLYC